MKIGIYHARIKNSENCKDLLRIFCIIKQRPMKEKIDNGIVVKVCPNCAESGMFSGSNM